MDFDWLGGLLGFALAMAATPGPNNTMVAATSATCGVGRTLPLMAGMAIGVGAIMLMVAAFGSSIVADARIGAALKWTGVAYLLWLAWKIANAEPPPDVSSVATQTEAAPMSFTQGALLQVVNPKLWVMVSGAMATYGQAASDLGSIALASLFALVFTTTTFISTIAWAALGASVGRLLVSNRTVRVFNTVMAALLIVSLIPIVFE